MVLYGLGAHAGPRAEAALLAYAGHPDAGVRRAVADGFGTWPEQPAFPDDVREALLLLMTDVDTAVRGTPAARSDGAGTAIPSSLKLWPRCLLTRTVRSRSSPCKGSPSRRTSGAWKRHAVSARRAPASLTRRFTSAMRGGTSGAVTVMALPENGHSVLRVAPDLLNGSPQYRRVDLRAGAAAERPADGQPGWPLAGVADHKGQVRRSRCSTDILQPRPGSLPSLGHDRLTISLPPRGTRMASLRAWRGSGPRFEGLPRPCRGPARTLP